MSTQETIGTVLDRMVDEYIMNLRENGSIRKPNMKSLIKVYKPAKKDLKDLLEDYHIFLRDVTDAIEENDNDLVEAWDFLNKTKLGHLRDFVENVSSFLEENSKIKRKRKINLDSVVKNVKYLQSHGKIESVSPKEILDSKIAICFNVKQNKIYYYEASDSLWIKGTSIINYDENLSFAKNYGRCRTSIDDINTSMVEFGKRVISQIKAKSQSVSGRLNSDTIILKVSK